MNMPKRYTIYSKPKYTMKNNSVERQFPLCQIRHHTPTPSDSCLAEISIYPRSKTSAFFYDINHAVSWPIIIHLPTPLAKTYWLPCLKIKGCWSNRILAATNWQEIWRLENIVTFSNYSKYNIWSSDLKWVIIRIAARGYCALLWRFDLIVFISSVEETS